VDIERLINAKVAVVGCGTVGTQIIEFLASSGLGNINLGDTDVISLANTQRVDIWTTSDVGKSKALVDSRYIFHKNPHLVQTVFNEGLTTHNVNDFIPEGTNVVISAVDDPQMMYLICARAKELEIPFILATDLDEAVVVDITDFSTHPEAELLFGRITGTKLNDIMAQIKVLEPYATNGDQAAINKIKVLKGNILRKIVKPTDASARMIKWFRGYVKGETGNEGLPQTHTAARQAGTYGGVAALGFILGQQITDHVKIDARQLLSPKKDNLSSSLQQKKQLLGLVGDVLRPKVTDALSKMRSKLLKQSLIRALANVMDLYNMLV